MADESSAESDEWMLTASTRIALILDHGRELAAFRCLTPRCVPMAHRHCGGIYSDPDNLFVDKRAASCDFSKERETQIDILSSGFPRSGCGTISTDTSR
jgi:hypothetical protein